METTRKGLEMEIQLAEDAYTEYGKDIPDSRWGHEQEETHARLAQKLQKLYDEAGTPEDDRIAL
jgi:hypothetical protein